MVYDIKVKIINGERYMKYNPSAFESKWQKRWEENNIFKREVDDSKEKYYCLEMLPYPSGNIHMGHVRNYSIGDVVSRFKFMQGLNVIHPMGWDAFGLPAENAAKQNNRHPADWTYSNIANMKEQLKKLGFSYDWTREVATCAPEYYKWEQKIFIELWKKGLAYKKKSLVNWCPECETVLANEQVEDGHCWRCSSVVEMKELEQWFLKITEYADELLEYTYKLKGWPEKVLTMQRNWIGKSIGAEIIFKFAESDKTVTVFTTRPDTLYGATFMLLAPEHPMIKDLLKGTEYEKDGLKFIADIAKQDKADRTDNKQKKGFFTGRYVINPVNNTKLPVYIANYVLMDYGTGAVMAVPAHDTRDFEFAKEYNLPIKIVIQPEGEELNPDKMTEAYTGAGKLVNSGELNGLDYDEAKKKIIENLAKDNAAKASVNFRLRDWGISRQRYWGSPIPFVYCEKCGMQPVKEEDLPVELPKNVDFKCQGNPLDTVDDFVNTTCPVCGGKAKRETDTMDTFMESSWYFLRYCSPKCDTNIFDKKEVDYWMPVDQYIGGIEHAVMHLLYARFFTKVLRDMGYLSFDEPFTNLLTQGMVCKETWKCEKDGWLFPSEVKDGKCCKCGSDAVKGRVEKMSKSKKNVVDPGVLNDQYGADTIRLFSVFAAPPENEIEWSENGVEGCYRFINRVFRLVVSNMDILKAYNDTPEFVGETAKTIIRATHAAVKKVTNDIARFQLNTAVSAIMEMVNTLYLAAEKLENDNDKTAFSFSLNTLITILAPFTPHVAEELNELAGNTSFIAESKWPEYEEKYTISDEIVIVVQINGKVRASFTFPRDIDENTVFNTVLNDSKVLSYLEGKELVKKIFIKNKLVSLVVK